MGKTMTHDYTADQKAAHKAGREAAERHQSFNDYCPHTFKRAAVSQREFDVRVRPLMDAWFDGWKNWLTEHGLGFNFKPKK